MGFLLINTAQAAEYTCAPDSKGNPQCPPPPAEGEKDKTRIQVAIPGLTSSCTYKTWKLDESGNPIDVPATCYYTESLPDFVRKLYTFSIGLIAVAAVLMIMIAGLKWIFAAGDPGKITAAKGDVIAAIVAVLLSLSSYVILNTINPRLTNISLPGITKIEPTELVESNWCVDRDGKKHSGETIYVIDKNGKKIDNVATNTECGYNYAYGIKNSKGDFEKVGVCDGRGGCNAEGTMCLRTDLGNFCLNPEEYCKKYDKNNCSEVTKKIRDGGQILDKSCISYNDYFIIDSLAGDDCRYGRIVTCGDNKYSTVPVKERISCFDHRALNGCNESSGAVRNSCTDDFYVNKESKNTICCHFHYTLGDEDKFGSYSSSSLGALDCSKVRKCEDYYNFDTGDWLKNNDKSYCNVGCP